MVLMTRLARKFSFHPIYMFRVDLNSSVLGISQRLVYLPDCRVWQTHTPPFFADGAAHPETSMGDVERRDMVWSKNSFAFIAEFFQQSY